MDHIEFAVRDAASPWSGARQYRIGCPHGVSSATVVPGASPLADRLVVDLMLAGHQRRHRCRCELPSPPAPVATAILQPVLGLVPTRFLA